MQSLEALIRSSMMLWTSRRQLSTPPSPTVTSDSFTRAGGSTSSVREKQSAISQLSRQDTENAVPTGRYTAAARPAAPVPRDHLSSRAIPSARRPAPRSSAASRRASATSGAGARSEAAAEGILQLRPETAERVAAILGLQAPADGSLRDPAVAIGLGLAYLGLLGSRFPDVPVLVAAYNAGPAAGAWASGVPLDEWVENIPYRETRQYVRAVLGDWARYRRVLGEPAPALEAGRPVAPPLEGASF